MAATTVPDRWNLTKSAPEQRICSCNSRSPIKREALDAHV